MLLLDIALDNYFRLCIERTDKNSLSGDDLLELVGLVLRNACIAGESQDFGQVRCLLTVTYSGSSLISHTYWDASGLGGSELLLFKLLLILCSLLLISSCLLLVQWVSSCRPSHTLSHSNRSFGASRNGSCVNRKGNVTKTHNTTALSVTALCVPKMFIFASSCLYSEVLMQSERQYSILLKSSLQQNGSVIMYTFRKTVLYGKDEKRHFPHAASSKESKCCGKVHKTRTCQQCRQKLCTGLFGYCLLLSKPSCDLLSSQLNMLHLHQLAYGQAANNSSMQASPAQAKLANLWAFFSCFYHQRESHQHPGALTPWKMLGHHVHPPPRLPGLLAARQTRALDVCDQLIRWRLHQPLIVQICGDSTPARTVPVSPTVMRQDQHGFISKFQPNESQTS